MHLEEFLLSETHIKIKYERQLARQKCESDLELPRQARWPEKHIKIFESKGKDWAAPTPQISENVYEIIPEYGALTLREQDLIVYHGIAVPPVELPDDSPERTLDVSQSLTFRQVRSDGVDCLTGTSKLWLEKRARVMHGVECLRLQGIFVPDTVLNQFENAFMTDLGGNAFSTPCCSCTVMAMLIAHSSLVDDSRSIET